MKRLLLALLVGTAVSRADTASALELSLSGFTDVTAGANFGPTFQPGARADFEAFGLDPFPKSSSSGFGIVGADFVLQVDPIDRLTVLAEINLQLARGDQTEFELDPERIWIGYEVHESFKVMAGIFFTPVGYFNRTLYARSWLMTSVQVPDLFEEEYNFIPTHTVGVQAYGQFNLPANHRLAYAVSLGNGRGNDPGGGIFGRDTTPFRAVTALLEWHVPGEHRQLSFGVSGWFDDFESYYVPTLGQTRSTTDPTTQKLHMREFGADLHAVYYGKWLNFILEGVAQWHIEVSNVMSGADRVVPLYGALAEVSLNVGPEGRIKPYLRFDLVQLAQNGGPYLGLRQDGTNITRYYVPSTRLAMAGVAYDFNRHLRVKLEYSFAFAGPRPQHGIVAQAAVGF